MKRLLKKVSASLLTAALVAGLCFPAFATSKGEGTAVKVTEGSTADITVGVSNPEDGSANGGDTLQAYKVVSITYADNKLSYEFTDAFKAFLAANETWASEIRTPDDYAEVSNESEKLKELLGNFAAYVKDQKITPDKSVTDEENGDGVVTFDSMPMGQYIIVGAGTSKGAKIYQTVTAEVNPTVVDGSPVLYPEYTVAMKTSKPSVDKAITGGTVADDKIPDKEGLEGDKHDGKHQQTSEIGKEITYQLKVSVPTYPEGATNKTFYVGDMLSKGLDFVDGSLKVTGNDTTTTKELAKDDDYTLGVTEIKDPESSLKTGTQLFVDFDFDNISAYTTVVIEYKAKLNADANLGTTEGNPNNVELIYSNDPYNGNSWKPGDGGDRPGHKNGYGKDEDLEIVHMYALVIDKFEEKHEGEKLSGAEFELYRDEACTDPVTDADGNVVLVTDANGAAQYAGLEMGDYYLKETKAPEDYNLMTEVVKIEINATNIPFFTKRVTSVNHYTYTTNSGEAESPVPAEINGVPAYMNPATGEVKTFADSTEVTEGFEIAYVKSTITEETEVIEINKDAAGGKGYYKAGISNNKGAHLPSTGGMGTTMFTVIGIVLMLGAAIVMITRRRMSRR
ncbi:SpaA isopeptide-forming pilin-related protein [Clostridium transplantifaecale]|uniref:SpaA isopeptide-forming pilin-related protein n=1 Tax=Clostridium transplantifaecale TaxID=2479838 RepID=UPI000F637963|nr:SpaA isopeptide-forming pilin-related protein [Clostridium transplantifaecale]